MTSYENNNKSKQIDAFKEELKKIKQNKLIEEKHTNLLKKMPLEVIKEDINDIHEYKDNVDFRVLKKMSKEELRAVKNDLVQLSADAKKAIELEKAPEKKIEIQSILEDLNDIKKSILKYSFKKLNEDISKPKQVIPVSQKNVVESKKSFKR